MQFSLLLIITLLLSPNAQETVDTYDWSVYKAAAIEVNQAIGKLVDAQIILNNHLELDLSKLPHPTQSQLAIISDKAYRLWLQAEGTLGVQEANKYWDKYLSKDNSNNLECFSTFEKRSVEETKKSYQQLSTCNKPKITLCHIEVIQIQVNEFFKYHKCIEEKYGKRNSPLEIIKTMH